jgi:hypothetical protein
VLRRLRGSAAVGGCAFHADQRDDLACAGVGQPVAVSLRPSTQPGLLRFEINRSLTGMGHERYTSVDSARGESPSATLARRLLETGEVESVHIYGNIITVDLHKGYSGAALQPIIEDLHIYYRPGFVPPPLEMPAEEAPAAGGAATGDAEGGPVDAALARVPAVLLERSRLAKERWLAKQAG